ncbi:type 1 fimbrial protein [Enterobacter sp. Cy-643]|uniref:fimbrial protein n=1 Tax=Enterobacter sp. Cy-643 TaxID=2608346 RepID=UPI00142478AD|nr:fimbrial protein [Enterobacter sp. Cy-643]NIF33020.1 type 1 fimbrial protein [Enterobacter sp. Cy-643]
MKVNKIASIIALSMGLFTMGAQAADEGKGEVKFIGSIIDAACSINPDSSEQEVDLGQITVNQLASEGRSKAQAFNIKLENCTLDEDKANTVSITFNGESPTGSKLLGIIGTTGAGVGIGAATGAQIELGKKTFVQNLTEGDNTLLFSAWLQGLAGAVAVPGEFYASTNFTMQYD